MKTNYNVQNAIKVLNALKINYYLWQYKPINSSSEVDAITQIIVHRDLMSKYGTWVILLYLKIDQLKRSFSEINVVDFETSSEDDLLDFLFKTDLEGYLKGPYDLRDEIKLFDITDIVKLAQNNHIDSVLLEELEFASIEDVLINKILNYLS